MNKSSDLSTTLTNQSAFNSFSGEIWGTRKFPRKLLGKLMPPEVRNKADLERKHSSSTGSETPSTEPRRPLRSDTRLQGRAREDTETPSSSAAVAGSPQLLPAIRGCSSPDKSGTAIKAIENMAYTSCIKILSIKYRQAFLKPNNFLTQCITC